MNTFKQYSKIINKQNTDLQEAKILSQIKYLFEINNIIYKVSYNYGTIRLETNIYYIYPITVSQIYINCKSTGRHFYGFKNLIKLLKLKKVTNELLIKFIFELI